MATPGRSLELYYIDGRPDGMLTAEMFNWTGHVLMAPRTQLADALVRPEAGYAGVYLLLGELDGEPLAYVGEGEDISARIKSHDVAKDWWTSVVLVTTAGNKLNKAHVRYLEARLIEEARKIRRMPLDNGTAPSRPGLSEADVAKMEAFLENLLIVLPALRVDMFIERSRPLMKLAHPTSGVTPDDAAEARFHLFIKKHGLSAKAILRDGEFVVEAGSQARSTWEGVGSEDSSYAELHRELSRAGVLTPAGNHAVFTRNYAFKSPSAAAAVVTGRPSNGTIEWKTEGGETYKTWEAKRLGVGEPH
ncbi:GIY-YIG nuclease family protein [Phenylobacterium sp.]|uniref:GIY-YIG nuclease family protein n=1 Tax=Phenylobacterium sp. TaxID=1871053 RepID=UPI00272FFDA2|nr:GIY-YIG nuclease family protein [Phenylobacterium sp.]MDP2214100.1 GIY-YIG nuclease family protein [Phenylobacterium sp.]